MKIIYKFWIGQKWKQREFILPELVDVDFIGQFIRRVNTLKFTAGEDFFAFLTFNRDNDKGSLYLFHKEENGTDWSSTEYRNITLESGSRDYPNEAPVLLAGEDFVAVGTNRPGKLLAYTWNGSGWNSKSISQGTGQFYYAAANNFIIALDEDGNTDWVTGVSHSDNYYIHYLDAEKRWQTKSWSAAADPYISGTDSPSYLYASNSMVGFMADNQDEYILRWDKDYNLIAVDDVLGEYTDTYPLLPVMGNMFVLLNSNTASGNPYKPIKGIGFDGSTWTVDSFNSDITYALGNNTVLTSRWTSAPNHQSYIHRYDPNTHQWSNSTLGPSNINYGKGFGQDFFVIKNNAYTINNTGVVSSLGQISNYAQAVFSYNNLSGVYNKESINGSSSEARYLYLNKANGQIETVVFPTPQTLTLGNGSVPQLGNSPETAMSPNTFYLEPGFKKIVHGELNKIVKDIVVESIDIDNGNSEVREITFQYNNDHTLPDDQSTFYGEVIVQNKGYGSGNIGKTKKYFKTGEEDVQMAGLPTKVVVEDKNGDMVSETETIWTKYTKNYINTDYRTVGRGYYLRPTQTTEKLHLDGQNVTTTTNNNYNGYGLLSSSFRTNSEGLTEANLTRYAYQEYSFVSDKNMLSFPYETKTNVGSQTVAVERSIWKSEGGKVYMYQNQSGTATNNLRINSEITKVDGYGNVQESNNGAGIYKSVLYGYGNLYPVATITNTRYTDAVNALDVSYSSLQNLSNGALQTELQKLYDNLPTAMTNINIYDEQGRVIRTLDERGEAVNFIYDTFGRLEYTIDNNDKVIEKMEYNFGTN